MDKNNFNDCFSFLMAKLNISYNKIDDYKVAFTHPSYINESSNSHLKHYQRLEFLGDSILGFLVAEYLYKTYELPEGEMTRIRAMYVCTTENAVYSHTLGLDELIIVGNSLLGDITEAIYADIFESFLGALYLDKGLEEVRKLLSIYVFPQIKSHGSKLIIDYKSKLQECIQAESRLSVTYELISSSGPAHDRVFEMGVYHDNMLLGVGVGKTKKAAEQLAAKKALSKMVGVKE